MNPLRYESPANGLDTVELTKYVRAIDDRSLPEAQLRWTSQHSAELTARLQPNHVLATQISYFPGWKASLNGKELKTYADGLAFLVIDPKCDGDCTVQINYDGGPEL